MVDSIIIDSADQSNWMYKLLYKIPLHQILEKKNFDRGGGGWRPLNSVDFYGNFYCNCIFSYTSTKKKPESM